MKTTALNSSSVALGLSIILIAFTSPPLCPTAAAAENVIELKSYWRMFMGTQEASSPPNTWRAPQFNDSGWTQTLVPVGYPSLEDQNGVEAALATILPSSSASNYTTLFLRRSFVITNLSLVQALKLILYVDDGAIAWLNGIEVVRYNVPAGELAYNATATLGMEANPQQFLIPSGPIVEGTSVLAVQVLNSSIASSDMAFAATLEVIANEPPAVASALPPLNTQANSLGLVEVFFNEGVTNVDAADLLLNGVPATNMVSYAPNDYLFYFAEPQVGLVQVSFAGNHGIRDLNAVPLPFAGTNWTYALDTNVTAGVWISEFLADNVNGIEDEDGNNSDWIEIYNAGPSIVDLSGWHLTDDRGIPDKWSFPHFPNMSLGPNSYLLVWASGKNRTNDITRLHTNFRLERSGEYLGLFNPNGQVVSEFAPKFPQQFVDNSYGRDRADPNLVGYYTVPTPRQQNLISGTGFSDPPVPFVDSGVFTADAITVEIWADANAVIRYTLNGSEPTNGSPVYASPLVFNSNIVLKARAFQPGLWPSPIIARTYNFLDPSAQNFSSKLPIVIVNTSGRAIPQNIPPGGNRLRGSLVVIDTFRGRSSIQQTPQFQGLAQFEIYGQTAAGFPKQPYRIEVNDELGNDKAVSLLGLPPEADFQLEVKMSDKSFINGFLAHELHQQMGHYAPRRRFVEVFVDTRGGKIAYPDDYVGVYELTEKIERDRNRVDIAELTPSHTTEPEITGGYIFKKDKDSAGDMDFTIPGGMGHASQFLKIHEPKPRFITPQQFAYLTNYLYHFSASLHAPNWLELTGTNHYSNYVDVDSFVDQHWIVEYAKNIDGYRLSRFWSKDRGGKIKDFPIWDFDLCFGNANYLEGGRTNGWYWNEQQEGMTSAEHAWLRRMLYGTNNIAGGLGGANATNSQAIMHSGDPSFIQKMIDRWGELRTNVFGNDRVLARVDELAAFLDEAAERNYVKFRVLSTPLWPNPDGTGVWNVNYATQTNYAGLIRELKKWIDGRFHWLDAQFVHSPILSHPGGPITGPTPVNMDGPPGATIYYTTDGMDPRAPNGAVAPAAQIYSTTITINDNARVFARARIGTNQYSWSPPAAETFVSRVPPLRITEIMYHPAQDGLEYLVVVNISEHSLNLAGFQLSGGVDFTFPNITLQSGQHAFVVENQAAFTARYGPGNLVAGEYSGRLDNGGERLVLTGPLREPILDFTYDDVWYPTTDGLGFSLVIIDSEAATSTWGDPASWRPSGTQNIPRVVINEVGREPVTGDVALVELWNLASESADISRWYLTDDLDHLRYQIWPGTFIPAGGYLTLTQFDFGAGFAHNTEELFLLSASPNGTLSGYLAQARVSGQRGQMTSGRYINSLEQEQFVPLQQPTFNSPNAGPFIPAVVISEIMYRPPDVLTNGAYWDNTEDEYVELHNRTGAAVTLGGYHLKGAGIDYRFGSVMIQPGAYLLAVSFDPVANTQQLASFRAKYDVSASVQIVGPYTGSLANGAGGLETSLPALYPQFEAQLERIDYGRNAPWPSLPDGSGLSLHRVALNEYANDPVNWQAGSASPGKPFATGPAPVITAQPQSRTVVASPGVTTTFSVEVADSNVHYQWRKNTQLINGATQSTLTVSVPSTAAAGNYDVLVSTDSGFTISSNAVLTVLIGIRVVQQPQSLTVRVPGSARFAVLASSPSPITYQWRFNGVPIPQANASELFLPNTSEESEGLYDVMMTDSIGSIVSEPARLAILAPPELVAPVPPLNLAASAGEHLTVSARVRGTLPMFVRWRWSRPEGGSFALADRVINDRVTSFSFPVPTGSVGRVLMSLTNIAGGNLGILGVATNAIVTVLADTDHDGIPDAYEHAHGMNENNPADAAADPDGDGMTNHDEYIAGTDPQDANSYLRVELGRANLATIRFQAVSNRSYTVQYIDSLNLPRVWQHLEHIVARPTNFSATVTDSASAPQRFYRLATPAAP